MTRVVDPYPNDTINSLRAEVERLRAEVQTWQGHAKTAIWSDSEECKMLTADNERLRAALKRIDKMEAYFYEDSRDVLYAKIGIMRDIARAALEQHHDQ